MILRAIHNRRNFFSDYWLGTLSASRAAVGPRLTLQETRKRMRRLTRLVDSAGGTDRMEPAAFRERLARPLLADVFDFAIVDSTIAPNVHLLRAFGASATAPALAAVYLCHDATDIERPSVRQALDSGLAASNLDHGFIVTPSTIRLVRRSGDGPRLGALDVSLLTLRQLEDDASLHAAYRLFSANAFAIAADGRRPIDVLEAESREHSAKVSTELKGAVFQAAERLVGAFQADVSSEPGRFGEVTPSLTQVRDAGFLALYRLLFILYAESRDERLAAHRLYKESYGLEGLVGSLLETPIDTLAGNRTRIWSRVQVLFRVFNEGLAPKLPDFENIPPRGGRLFSDATPEGALLAKMRVNDRVAYDVLLALATSRPRRGVGRERVSFRELEIEQLGAVYEGLLEYEPTVAEQLRLAVEIGGRELVLTPEQLVLLCEQRGLVVSGDPMHVVGTAAEQLHPGNTAAEDEIPEPEDDEEDRDTEEEEAEELSAGQPLRLLRRLEAGTFYFRPGGARKSSGSFYTPTPMVDFLVRKALGPLTVGRSVSEIERLRVVDIACGSAHFLVGAARFLGAKLHEAYLSELQGQPPLSFAPEGTSVLTMQERWASEGAAWCKRRVVERCVYGVDLNPAAVQLAQVALWIESLAGDRPLSFFAHHVRVGNSLQGTFADHFDAPPDPRLAASRTDTLTLGLFESNIRQRIEAALGERRLIDAELPAEIRPDTPEEFQYKEDRLRRSEAALADARLLMDLRSAAPFLPAVWADLPGLGGAADPQGAARSKSWWGAFEAVRARERFFHWELEFPEVLLRADRPGFDAVLGNPPWDKVLPNRREFYADQDPLVLALKGGELGQRIRQLHRENEGLEHRFEIERDRTTTFARILRKGGDFPLAKPSAESDEDGTAPRQRRRSDQNAHEDLAKYFVDRSIRLTRVDGYVGLVVPAVVYNGDACVGIRQYLLRQADITDFYAFENRRKIFPIHASYKFANLVARIGHVGSGAFDAAFMRVDLTELADGTSRSWMVRITRGEIEQLSPATLTILEFQSPKDLELVRRMSHGRPTLGGTGPGSWVTRLIGWRQHEIVYNSTEDRDLMSNPTTGRYESAAVVLGSRIPADAAAQVEQMQRRGYWPVYGGEQVAPYLVGVKPIVRWLSIARAVEKYGERQRAQETLVYRDQARSTDERTCIAALLPPRSAAAYTLTAAVFENVDSESAVIVLNSMCFDFLLRVRMAGMHVSGTYILPVAVPEVTVAAALPRVRTSFAPSLGIRHVSERDSEWPILWRAERAVAEAYGLGPADFAHVLQSFPV